MKNLLKKYLPKISLPNFSKSTCHPEPVYPEQSRREAPNNAQKITSSHPSPLGEGPRVRLKIAAILLLLWAIQMSVSLRQNRIQAVRAIEMIQQQQDQIDQIHTVNRQIYFALDALNQKNLDAQQHIQAIDSTYHITTDTLPELYQKQKELIHQMFQNILDNLQY